MMRPLSEFVRTLVTCASDRAITDLWNRIDQLPNRLNTPLENPVARLCRMVGIDSFDRRGGITTNM